MESLFSTYDPLVYQQQQQAKLNEQANAFSAMPRQQQADNLGFKFGAALGQGVGSLLGVEDKGLKAAQAVASVMKEVDLNDEASLSAGALKLGQMGYKQAGEELYKRYTTLKQSNLETRSKTAAANKAELSLKQEEALRAELSKLGPDATEEDYLSVVRKYGSPDAVMKSIETRLQKQQAAEAKIEAARVAAEAKVEAAKQAGATAAQIAQMRTDAQVMIAQMRTDMQREIAAGKQAAGDKPLTPLQQEKKKKELAKSSGALRSLDSSFEDLSNKAEALVTHPGFEGAQGTATYFPTMRGSKVSQAENLLEEFKASIKKTGLELVRQGGSIGAMTEKEWPIVEAMVAAIDPKAGNVKDQVAKAVAYSEKVRNNAYATHNETYDTDLAPPATKKEPKKDDTASWNAKWAALKSGQSLVGLDGKTYTKK